MRNGSIRFSPGMNRWFYGVFGALFLSGVLWLGTHYGMRQPVEFDERRSLLETWLLKIHGAAAMASLVVLGVLLPLHMQRAWELGRNRTTGMLVATACLILIASGYGLYYSGSEEMRPWVSGLHSVAGCLLPVALIGHILSGRKRKRTWRSRTVAHRESDLWGLDVDDELAGGAFNGQLDVRRRVSGEKMKDAVLTDEPNQLR